jgi:seryl-tRNA synthetase
VIDLKRLRQDPEGTRAALARRMDASAMATLDRILALDVARRELLLVSETLKAKRNAETEEVAKRKRAGTPADELLAALKQSSDEIKLIDARLKTVDESLEPELLTVPNLLLADVPDGDATGNRITRTWGTIPTFDFTPKAHWDLGEALGILDLANGAKVTGSGFPILRGMGARLARALGNFMLDLHTREHGYEEVAPPYLVNQASMQGTGQLPKFGDELYTVGADGLYLIPTSEVPLTNLYRDTILEASALPVAVCAWTPCFRREAGAAGKDTRGLIRVHQFDKVELVRLCRPEDSDAQHALIVRHAETVLEQLELPYRRLALAAGDTGFHSARTWDLEVWAAGVGTWLEVSSASTFTDFQARRAGIRFRPSPGAKPELVHTLNASGLAFPRTIIALLENNQAADGSVRIPGALAPYLGTDRLVARA